MLRLMALSRAGSLPQVLWRGEFRKQKRSVRTLRFSFKPRLLADLLFLDFRQGLAVNAHVGGRAGFQSLDANFDAAGLAPAIFFVFDQLQRFVYLLDQLALTITGAQFKAELFFLAGTICRVREVGRFVFHVIDCTVDFLHQVLFPLIQDLGEVSAHGLAHVLFALYFFVGFEAADRLVLLLLCLGGHEIDRLYSCNPLRRIAPSPTPAGPAAASGRTYQIKSGRATPGCRGGDPRCLQMIAKPCLVVMET